MSKRDIEVIRDQYDAVNERDFGRAMSHYSEDVELVVPPGTFLTTGSYSGREAVGGWFGDWFETFDRDARFDVREITELDDGSVLLVADHHARGRTSGAEVHGEVVWVYRLRSGRIIHVEGFESREKAVAGR